MANRRTARRLAEFFTYAGIFTSGETTAALFKFDWIYCFISTMVFLAMAIVFNERG